MKYALHSVSYSGTWGGVALPFVEFLDRAHSFGYQAVEVMAKRPHISPVDYRRSSDRQRLADLIAAKGLEVSCVADYHDWCWDGVHRDMPYHERSLLWLQATCELAVDLRCQYVRTFTGYTHEELPHRQQWEYCVKSLREGAEFANSLGIAILIQPHQGLTMHYQDALSLIREIDMPNVKLQLDPPYVHRIQVPMATAVQECGDLLAYTVLGGHKGRSNALYLGTQLTGRAMWQSVFETRAVGLDEADEDTKGFLAALKARGYRGPHIGYEICSMPLRGGSLQVLDDLAQRSLRFLRETWESL